MKVETAGAIEDQLMNCPTTQERIRASIIVQGEHWIWIGETDSRGDPRFRIGRRTYPVWRVFLLHNRNPQIIRCPDRLCVRPHRPAMTPQKRAQSIRRRLRSIDSHWIWLGAQNSQGQPVIRVNGRIVPLARFLWEAHHNQTVRGRLVRYRCSMRLCVRPSHHRDTGA